MAEGIAQVIGPRGGVGREHETRADSDKELYPPATSGDLEFPQLHFCPTFTR
jgi:hypothetical protein